MCMVQEGTKRRLTQPPMGKKCRKYPYTKQDIAPKLLFPFSPFFSFQRRINILQFPTLTNSHELNGISLESFSPYYSKLFKLRNDHLLPVSYLFQAVVIYIRHIIKRKPVGGAVNCRQFGRQYQKS